MRKILYFTKFHFIQCLKILLILSILTYFGLIYFYKQKNTNLNMNLIEEENPGNWYLTTEEISNLLKEREAVLAENKDEFIEQVFKEIKFEEIHLLNEEIREKNAKYDADIEKDFEKIVPKFGNFEKGPISYEPMMFDPNLYDLMEDSLRDEAFNLPLSQMISPNRTVPVSRMYSCDAVKYDSQLPTLSVIIVNKNEPLSTLTRTLHGIVNRTPRSILKEIVLIDDANTLVDLQGKLERYLVTQFRQGIIRFFRLKSRAGLIKARMIGAHFAIGDVIFFIDAHTEVEKVWAEPLLQRIKENRKRIACPDMKGIGHKNLHYGGGRNTNNKFSITGFWWSGIFRWMEIPKYENKRREFPHTPARSPTSMGAAFAIDRKYFWEIGSYDPGMMIWGGENLELPIRNWMCGGEVEVVPCSIIGHLYKQGRTYSLKVNESNRDVEVLDFNMKRLAEVWFDEYKELFYYSKPIMRNYSVGDLTQRKQLRERLNCNNFKWYLDNVYKEQDRMHIGVKFAGQLKKAATLLCIDSLSKGLPYFAGLWECHKVPLTTQLLQLTEEGALKLYGGCAQTIFFETKEKEGVLCLHFIECNYENMSQMEKWSFNEESGHLRNENKGKCATYRLTFNDMIFIEDCNNSNIFQKWIFIPFPAPNSTKTIN